MAEEIWWGHHLFKKLLLKTYNSRQSAFPLFYHSVVKSASIFFRECERVDWNIVQYGHNSFDSFYCVEVYVVFFGNVKEPTQILLIMVFLILFGRRARRFLEGLWRRRIFFSTGWLCLFFMVPSFISKLAGDFELIISPRKKFNNMPLSIIF